MCRMCILPHVGMGHNAHARMSVMHMHMHMRYVPTAYAVGTKRPEIEKLIGTLHCQLSLTISHTLHLATLTLGNGSEALNPAGFTVFDKFSQGGADLKDCSRSSMIFNQCRVLLRRINFETIKRKGKKC